MAVAPGVVLVVHRGVDGVERVALDQARQVIGRRAPADVILNNEYVSGTHPEIIFGGGQCAICLTPCRVST